LLAKKSTKSKKAAKGFGTQTKEVKPKKDRSEIIASDGTNAMDVSAVNVKSSKASTKQDASAMTEDDVFKKYGISDDLPKASSKKPTAAVAPEDSPFGAAVLANIPMKTQLQIDNFLITATFSSLAFCVLCGVGISTSAIKVAIPSFSVPQWVDSLVLNVLDPAFTPSFLIFFFFSITFGVFKFAQVSSSQTVYRELDK
jgi:hypothetical protein